MIAGPVASQPSRPRTPPGVGPPLRAAGLPDWRHPQSRKALPDVWGEKEGRSGRRERLIQEREIAIILRLSARSHES